jgi:hypothetical protein
MKNVVGSAIEDFNNDINHSLSTNNTMGSGGSNAKSFKIRGGS